VSPKSNRGKLPVHQEAIDFTNNTAKGVLQVLMKRNGHLWTQNAKLALFKLPRISRQSPYSEGQNHRSSASAKGRVRIAEFGPIAQNPFRSKIGRVDSVIEPALQEGIGMAFHPFMFE
jgi:hypothetical protein